MKFTRIFNNSLPLALCACMAFGFTACSDDEVKPQQSTVEDETFDDDACSDEYLIDYVMSQFAELNTDGSLYKRTTYFHQLDESDTTAIYTMAESKSEARAKFLSLLPDAYQNKVIVANDSAEMSVPMGTSPLMLKYKEGGTDGNVVATVQLPSQGAYTKIANTLTMVKSLGTNWDPAKEEDYIGTYKFISHYVLTSNTPIPTDNKEHTEIGMSIEKVDLRMTCYNVTSDGVAQYFFAPVLAEGENQLQLLETGKYLVPGLYPYLFNPIRIKNFKYIKETLPSPAHVRRFINGGKLFLDKHPYKRFRNEWYNKETQAAFERIKDSKNKLTEEEIDTFRYFYRIDEYMKENLTYTGVEVQRIMQLITYYPYLRTDYLNYKKAPQLPKIIEAKKDMPFFAWKDEWLENYYGDNVDFVAVDQRAMSIATNQLYDRNSNGEAHVVAIAEFDSGDWYVVERENVTDDKTYMYFFKPWAYEINPGTFSTFGRDINCKTEYPLRIVYLYEEKLK